MKNFLYRKETVLIISIFILSRLVAGFFGVQFEYDSIYKYWQYLDVETLKSNLLAGVWYNHAQPPLFNLFIGLIIKLSGSHSPLVFAILFKLITLINTLLIYYLLRKIVQENKIALILSILYLLSPATIVYENELFYTSFVSMLFLIAVVFLLKNIQAITWKSAIGLFLPLLLICLTRSMYHFIWLIAIAVIILFYARRKPGFNKLLIASVFSVFLLGGWYMKNYLIFGQFNTSSWIGMNFTRNVFHDQETKDSSRIGAFAPFSRISVYDPFRDFEAEKKFAGLNDRDLLQEFKNDSLMNMNHVGYITISKKYMDACKAHIRANPTSFLKNVAQSAIIFFAPATRYSVTEFQARKIKYYDAVYSFNISHFAKTKQERRIALTISAIPRGIIYLLVFIWLIRTWVRTRKISLLNLLVCTIIGYVFVTSSLIEHYENMRFRFELEPLFLLVFAQPVTQLINKARKKRVQPPVKGSN